LKFRFVIAREKFPKKSHRCKSLSWGTAFKLPKKRLSASSLLLTLLCFIQNIISHNVPLNIYWPTNNLVLIFLYLFALVPPTIASKYKGKVIIVVDAKGNPFITCNRETRKVFPKLLYLLRLLEIYSKAIIKGNITLNCSQEIHTTIITCQLFPHALPPPGVLHQSNGASSRRAVAFSIIISLMCFRLTKKKKLIGSLLIRECLVVTRKM